ncbi:MULTISPECIES: heme-binding protein [unclassified Nocardia]|uniref:GlcG/HbpS family heme-binding protein n=1 Tax=unclassified Nocardia TaxID=2637762 RepID=UPI001CE409E7|nr:MULTISPECIES: heme-binding protein [unclassified Nocardia]
MSISLEQADRVITAAKQAAAERGARITVAVVDASANLVAFARMDDAHLGTVDSAPRKATAAVMLGYDTVQFATALRPGQLLGHLLSDAPWPTDPYTPMPEPGGVLIRSDGATIGAVGVAGAGSLMTDHKIAAAAAGSR